MDFKQAVDFLHTKLGSYRKVAIYLDMSETHLYAMRTGRVNLPKKTEEYVILKAKAMMRK